MAARERLGLYPAIEPYRQGRLAVGVSLATPLPARHVLDMAGDLRVPGGETLYDREMRLLRLKNRATS